MIKVNAAQKAPVAPASVYCMRKVTHWLENTAKATSKTVLKHFFFACMYSCSLLGSLGFSIGARHHSRMIVMINKAQLAMIE